MTTDLDRQRSQLADCLAPRIGVDSVKVDGLLPPETGHASDMRVFTAQWEAQGKHTRALVARIQPDEQRCLFLEPDTIREGTVLDLLGKAGRIPVPNVLTTESDTRVFGRPFYVMEHVQGRIPPDEPCYHVGGFLADELDETQQAQLWLNGVTTLARLHNVDWHDGFEFLNQPARGAHGLDQYLEWVQRWYRWVQHGRQHEILDEALNFLLACKPPVTNDGIVWGDARIGNMIFSDDLTVAAVIDWDMVAFGPGEIDLGWWLAMDRLASDGLGYPRLPGLPSTAATIAHYEARRGCKTHDMFYFQVFGAFRFAVILLRFADLFRGTPLFNEDTTFGSQSHAVRLVAELLNRPVPELSADIAKVFMNERPSGAQAARSGAR